MPQQDTNTINQALLRRIDEKLSSTNLQAQLQAFEKLVVQFDDKVDGIQNLPMQLETLEGSLARVNKPQLDAFEELLARIEEKLDNQDVLKRLGPIDTKLDGMQEELTHMPVVFKAQLDRLTNIDIKLATMPPAFEKQLAPINSKLDSILLSQPLQLETLEQQLTKFDEKLDGMQQLPLQQLEAFQDPFPNSQLLAVEQRLLSIEGKLNEKALPTQMERLVRIERILSTMSLQLEKQPPAEAPKTSPEVWRPATVQPEMTDVDSLQSDVTFLRQHIQQLEIRLETKPSLATMVVGNIIMVFGMAAVAAATITVIYLLGFIK